MRDLIEAHDAFGRAMLADLTRRDARPPAEPVGGNSGGPVVQVHAGAGDGRVRSWESDPTWIVRAGWDTATANLGAVYDAALAIVRAAPPMPLESSIPWCEDDATRLRRLDDLYLRKGSR